MKDGTPPDILGYPSPSEEEIRRDLRAAELQARQLWVEVNAGRVTPQVAADLDSTQRRIESDYELLELMGALVLPRVSHAKQ